MGAVFNDIPWDNYTTFIVFDSTSGGGSALEHQSSHLGIYTPLLVESILFPSITAHEMIHAWNVKRLRPADMVPYKYSQPQPTTWLWVSEGITDYYSDVVLSRSGVDRHDGIPHPHAGQDRGDERRAAGRARGRVALDVDPSDRRHRIHLLPERIARRIAARHPDPRCERQQEGARRCVPRAVSVCVQAEVDGLHRRAMVGRGEPRGGREVVRRLQREVHRRPRADAVSRRCCRSRDSASRSTRSASRGSACRARRTRQAFGSPSVQPGSPAEAAGLRAGDYLDAGGRHSGARPVVRRAVPHSLCKGRGHEAAGEDSARRSDARPADRRSGWRSGRNSGSCSTHPPSAKA